MMKKVAIGLVLAISALFFGAIIYSALQPKPYSWEESYDSFDRQPYGTYIFTQQIKHFFPGNRIKRMGKKDFSNYYNEIEAYQYPDEDGNIDTTLYLEDLSDYYDLESFNFVGLSHHFYADDLNSRALLLHLFQGNHALVASYSSNLEDFLGIETELIEDSVNKTEKFRIKVGSEEISIKPHEAFSRITHFPDSAKAIAQNADGDVVGVQVKIGEGSLIYFTVPIAFTNYYILKDEPALSAALLKMLPNENTRWANFLTGGQPFQNSRSLLSFIHSQESLTWAFYLLVFSVIFYLLFQIKREQRPIPVINAPENVSLKFTEVLSNLYLIRKNHKDIILKKMTFFMEQIRNKYHLDTSNINEKFFEALSLKSKVGLSTVKLLFIKYERLTSQDSVDNEEFLYFNKLLQNFKQDLNERDKRS